MLKSDQHIITIIFHFIFPLRLWRTQTSLSPLAFFYLLFFIFTTGIKAFVLPNWICGFIKLSTTLKSTIKNSQINEQLRAIGSTCYQDHLQCRLHLTPTGLITKAKGTSIKLCILQCPFRRSVSVHLERDTCLGSELKEQFIIFFSI